MGGGLQHQPGEAPEVAKPVAVCCLLVACLLCVWFATSL